MATISTSTTTEKALFLFYGECEQPCEEFSLEAHETFFNAVYEYTDKGFARWYKVGVSFLVH